MDQLQYLYSYQMYINEKNEIIESPNIELNQEGKDELQMKIKSISLINKHDDSNFNEEKDLYMNSKFSKATLPSTSVRITAL